MCILIGTFYIWQIVQLREKRKSTPSLQLKYLQYATTAELFFALGRLVVVIASGFTIRQVEQIPQFLILLTITQLVMNTLAYIAIGGYWSERIASANAQSQNENLEIKALLNERESLISSLLKANKTAATGALSASIAHELNQPLGATQLNIQFLQKKLTDGNLSAEQNQEVLAALLNDNQRAANIIQSLRSIFSDGKIGVEKVDLNDLLQSVLKIAKSEIQAQSIRVVLNLQSTTLVTANRGEIQQVILNLINNAIQALSDSPRANRTISIESHDVPNGVKVIVTDDGEGISLDAQSHLFELLSSSEKRSGMGLGLWLCQHIISRHGGQIEYQDAPNGGAQFTVYLPTSQE
jgi:signal transduction histidine kinase